MDRQSFIDRMLETENLTDQLEDDDANILLDWGIGQIDNLLEDIDNDEELAGTRINNLMDFMRGLNMFAGQIPNVAVTALDDLVLRYNTAFAAARTIDGDEKVLIIQQVAQMQPGEAMRYLFEQLASIE